MVISTVIRSNLHIIVRFKVFVFRIFFPRHTDCFKLWMLFWLLFVQFNKRSNLSFEVRSHLLGSQLLKWSTVDIKAYWKRQAWFTIVSVFDLSAHSDFRPTKSDQKIRAEFDCRRLQAGISSSHHFARCLADLKTVRCVWL